MCDPLSVTTSVLAIIGFAAKSCECLHQTLCRFSEAPKELQNHLDAVQALQSIFKSIARIEKEDIITSLLTPDFSTRVYECICDLQTIEDLADSLNKQLQQGKTHRRAWMRLRLSLGDQREVLKTHLRRLESYHRTFSLHLLLLNLRLGLETRSQKQNQQEQSPLHHGSFDASLKPDLLPSAIRSYEEAPSPSSRHFWYLHKTFLKSYAWHGPVNPPGQQHNQTAHVEHQGILPGYGFTWAITWHRTRRFRLETVVLCPRGWDRTGVSLSFHWNISWPRTVQYDCCLVDIALRGDVEAMRKEVALGTSDPLVSLRSGKSLLHLAASRGHLNMVTFLLQQGSKVNAMDDFGETPLHIAVALSKNYDVCRVLLNHGADLWSCNAEGRTPLHNFWSPVLELLIRYHRSSVDTSSCDDRGMTPLHYVAWSSKTSLETFQAIQGPNNADLQMSDGNGRSLLHLAAQRGNLPVVNYLLSEEIGLDPRCRDSYGRTALHYAVESKRGALAVEAIASRGGDLSARDHDGRSALHHAAWARNGTAFKALLALGRRSELQVVDLHGLTPSELIAAHSIHRQEPEPFVENESLDSSKLIAETQRIASKSDAGTPSDTALHVFYILRFPFSAISLLIFSLLSLWLCVHGDQEW